MEDKRQPAELIRIGDLFFDAPPALPRLDLISLTSCAEHLILTLIHPASIDLFAENIIGLLSYILVGNFFLKLTCRPF